MSFTASDPLIIDNPNLVNNMLFDHEIHEKC
jgi:hypothetical protein